jgi:sorbitol-specific phosphotransferase system component IIA
LEKLKNQESSNNPFRQKYFSNPIGFLEDCIIWKEEKPAPYQKEIVSDLITKGRICVRGPHGLGKTAMMAWIILWFALTRDGEDWKIPTTASNWRQLTKYLWPEVEKWARRLKWDVIGRPPFQPKKELLDLSLKLKTGEAFALASDRPELIEGAHAKHLLYILDEAKTIVDETWNSVEGAFATGNCFALASSTPGDSSGRFYDIQSRKAGYENWHVRSVSLDEAIAAGRVSKQWADDCKTQWGEQSAAYINRVLGNFASTEENNVIPLAWVEAANERWDDWNERGKPEKFRGVGVDVARYGTDKTVIAPEYIDNDLLVFDKLHYTTKEDTMQTTGRVVIWMQKGGEAVVDVIGLGAGVVDRLRELGHKVIAFNASESTDQKDASKEMGFVNKRSAAWWTFMELLDPNSKIKVALPTDPLLTGDLITPTWKITSTGKIQVESKDEIIKRLGRSTDSGDSVIMIGGTKGQPKVEVMRMGG